MIDPRAVNDFLDEQRDTHVWIKNISSADLDDALEEQDFRTICPKLPLDKHQKACILLGLAFPRFAFWLDMGTGKTRIVLELLNHFWECGTLHRGMILAISDEAIDNWEQEIKKWGFKVPFVGVGKSSTAEKWNAVAELGAGIIITTYAGFNWLFASKVKVKKKKSKVTKVQMKPDLKRIKKFAANLQAFVPDESVHLGNHASLGWWIAERLTQTTEIFYALAGVPFGRDPTMLWSQQYLVDRGESLGETLGIFRSAFFTQKKGHFTRFEYKYDKSMEEELTRMMQHRSISYEAEECGDLKPVTLVPRRIKLSPEAYAYFDKAMEALRLARGDKQKIENLFLRMRQLSSGFIGYKDDETGVKAQLVMPRNPKLDDLLNNIEDMPRARKFVIFHEFTISGRWIMEGLEARGIKAGWLWSGTKNGRILRSKFDNDDPDKFKGLVINHFLGAESLNLQAANYLHLYERPVGYIRYKQARKRTFRKGQKLKGFQFDYIATPVDQRIIDFHEEGDDLFQALIRDPYKALKR